MKDAQFMTAKQKDTVLKQWARFIRNGFQFGHFTDSIYKHLTLHCSFIAHYDIHGFYNTYFVRPGDRMHFLRQFDRNFGCKSVECGGTAWIRDEEYTDINQAMCDAIEPCKRQIYFACTQNQKEMDVAAAKRLLGKHGIEMVVA